MEEVETVLRVSSSRIVGGIVLVAVKGADDEVFEQVCTGVPVDGGICVGLCLACLIVRVEDLVTSAKETWVPNFSVETGTGSGKMKPGVGGTEERTVEWPEEDECWCCKVSASTRISSSITREPLSDGVGEATKTEATA